MQDDSSKRSASARKDCALDDPCSRGGACMRVKPPLRTNKRVLT